MYKEFLINFTLVFLIWETIKVFIPHLIWKNAKVAWNQQTLHERKGGNIRINLQKKDPVLTLIGYIYLLYSLLLLCSSWWWVSLCMIALSSVSVASLKPLMKRNAKFSFKIWLVFFIDFICTVSLLSIVNPIFINFVKTL